MTQRVPRTTKDDGLPRGDFEATRIENKPLSASELQLAAKLNFPVVDRRGADAPERRGSERCGRIAEVRFVECVVQFKTNLKLEPLFDREVLEQRKVHVEQRRAMKQIAARGPVFVHAAGA